MQKRGSFFNFQNTPVLPAIEFIVLCALIFVSSFPYLEPDIGIGLDASYVWALNYLFVHDYSVLTTLIYPIGPLGFLKLPNVIHHNLAYALIFYSCIKLWFISGFLWLGNTQHFKIKPFAALITFIVALIIPFDYLIVGIVLLHALFLIDNHDNRHLIPMSLMATMGLLIKSSIGITSFSIVGIVWIIEIIRTQKWKHSLIWAGICTLLILSTGSVIMLGLTNFINFFFNTIRLSFGYSGALALHPTNDIWLILGFIASIILIPLLTIKEQNIKIAFIILLFPLFAIWKHAMSRQDITHYSMLIYFLILFWGILIVYSKKNRSKLIILATFSIMLIYANMKNIPAYRPIKIELNGINNFYNSVIKFKSFKHTYQKISQENLAERILNNEIVSIIGTNTVDVYPWELSYAAANNLNYSARSSLQGGSYNSWLDKIGAQDFSCENRAQFLIFHFVKDQWDGDFGSIDQRYLLNDSPHTIISILNNYTMVYKNKKMLLFEKTNTPQLDKPIELTSNNGKWDQWIDVPENNNSIVRLKANIKSSLTGSIQSFFYKSAPCFIDYKMNDGKILSYRFIPENAVDGLWIYPFIQYPNSPIPTSNVVAVRFRNDKQSAFSEKITYQYETIALNPNIYTHDASPSLLLGKASQNKFQVIAAYTINSASEEMSQNPYLTTTGKPQQNIKEQEYSFTWNINMDSVWKYSSNTDSTLLIETDVNYTNLNDDAYLIVSGELQGYDFWESKTLFQVSDDAFTGYVFANKIIEKSTYPHGIIKVYIWNPSNSDVSINDFKIKLGVAH